jgi:hypothetical protein
MGDLEGHGVVDKDFSFLNEPSIADEGHPADISCLDTTLTNISNINDVSALSGQKRRGTLGCRLHPLELLPILIFLHLQ